MKKKLIILIISFILIIISIFIIGVITYKISISKVSNDDKQIEIFIPMGSSTSTIASILKENGAIRSELGFKIYVKTNEISNLQPGTFYLKPNMNVEEITKILQATSMQDPNQITITFIEGKTFRWLASKIASQTNNTEQDVYNLLENEEYIDSLINEYWFLTDEIKSDEIYYSLEGYLFPDTYNFKNKDVTVEEIFKIMLNRTGDILQEYKESIDNSGYTVHQLITIASIIEMESMTEEGRKDVSSVIHNRLNANMAIQSDVTTYYAFKIDIGSRDLYQNELSAYNVYNTRGPNMEGKLPIGPISSVGEYSIEAALYPNNTDYLFFVADKNGKLYFTKTNSEHLSIIAELKEDGLWLEY